MRDLAAAAAPAAACAPRSLRRPRRNPALRLRNPPRPPPPTAAEASGAPTAKPQYPSKRSGRGGGARGSPVAAAPSPGLSGARRESPPALAASVTLTGRATPAPRLLWYLKRLCTTPASGFRAVVTVRRKCLFWVFFCLFYRNSYRPRGCGGTPRTQPLPPQGWAAAPSSLRAAFWGAAQPAPPRAGSCGVRRRRAGGGVGCVCVGGGAAGALCLPPPPPCSGGTWCCRDAGPQTPARPQRARRLREELFIAAAAAAGRSPVGGFSPRSRYSASAMLNKDGGWRGGEFSARLIKRRR